MPDIAHTRQAWWALNLTRFEIMSFLIQLGGESGVNSNSILINQLQRVCKYLDRENMLKALLPSTIALDVESFLNEAVKL